MKGTILGKAAAAAVTETAKMAWALSEGKAGLREAMACLEVPAAKAAYLVEVGRLYVAAMAHRLHKRPALHEA